MAAVGGLLNSSEFGCERKATLRGSMGVETPFREWRRGAGVENTAYGSRPTSVHASQVPEEGSVAT
jgi:hypothetical protein